MWESPSVRFPKHVGQASQNTPCLLKAHSSVRSDVFATFANSLHFTVGCHSQNKHILPRHPILSWTVDICHVCDMFGKVCRFCTLLMSYEQFWEKLNSLLFHTAHNAIVKRLIICEIVLLSSSVDYIHTYIQCTYI